MSDRATATACAASAPPTWSRLGSYLSGIRQVFGLYQAPTPEIRAFIACVLLVRDSTTLLSGLYGTGKTQLVHLVRQTFFTSGQGDGTDFGYVACTQDLTPLDTLFYLDLARLMRGEEVATPRAIVTARLKFINEVQRASSLVYNALLPLLSEKFVVYRDQIFRSPNYVCLLDANPLDVGSSEVPQAFKDRIDYSFDLQVMTSAGVVALQDKLVNAEGTHWGMLADLAAPVVTAPQMEELWADVRRVSVPREVELLVALLGAYLQRCRYVDRSHVSPDFELPCRECPFRPDTCAKLAEIPGTRFLISLLKLAQARAWLRRAADVGIDDVLYGLPYVLSHRLKVRIDSLRLYPSMSEWVREELYRRGIRGKIPRWRQLANYLLADAPTDERVLREFAARDLAVTELVGSLTKKQLQPVF